MPDLPLPTRILLTPAPAENRRRGHLGWVSFRLGEIEIHAVSVRRTRDGRHTLSFPIRHDRSGRQLPIVRPADDGARLAIEDAVFRALGLPRRAGGDGDSGTAEPEPAPHGAPPRATGPDGRDVEE